MKLKKILSKTIFVFLIAGICCFLWGSAFPSIKIGYRLFNISNSDTASIILFAGVRFFLAGVLTIIAFSITNKKPLLPTKKSIPKICVLSVFQTILQYILFYIGLAYTTGERASVIQGTNVFVALIISSLIFKYEKLTFKKIIGCIIGFAGVLLVSLDVFTQSSNNGIFGELLVFLCTVSYAFSTVFLKKYSFNENPTMLSGWQFLFGGAFMVVLGLLMGGRLTTFSPKAILLLLYLAFISATAYSLWAILLKHNPVSKVAVCGFLTPVFGFVLSSFFAGDNSSVGVLSVIALLLVIVGMLMVNTNKSKTTN